MNPEGSTVIRANDRLWLVGNPAMIRTFMEERKAVRE
jgi:Trk K+ transport system NAD-binding subunit